MPLARPGIPCPACRARLPLFSAARAATIYRDAARDALMTFKLGGERRAGALLAELMVPALDELEPDLITFVPSTRRSEAARGFNPAAELARHLAAATRTPSGRLLRKVRETRDQAALSASERRRNQDGAFRAPVVLGHKRIAIVDDIITTGATAEACARALRDAGAADVVVVAFARAP